MSTNFERRGSTWLWSNGTGTAVETGQVVVVGEQLGVALASIADGATGALAMDGLFHCPKAPGAAIAQGARVFWDVSAGRFAPTGATLGAGDLKDCAVAAETAAEAAETVLVRLNAGIGTVHSL